MTRKTHIFPIFFQGETIRNFLPHFVIHSKLRARHYSGWLHDSCQVCLCQDKPVSPWCTHVGQKNLFLTPSLTFSGESLHAFCPLGGSGVLWRQSTPQPLWWRGERDGKHDNACICLLLLGKLLWSMWGTENWHGWGKDDQQFAMQNNDLTGNACKHLLY